MLIIWSFSNKLTSRRNRKKCKKSLNAFSPNKSKNTSNLLADSCWSLSNTFKYSKSLTKNKESLSLLINSKQSLNPKKCRMTGKQASQTTKTYHCYSHLYCKIWISKINVTLQKTTWLRIFAINKEFTRCAIDSRYLRFWISSHQGTIIQIC